MDSALCFHLGTAQSVVISPSLLAQLHCSACERRNKPSTGLPSTSQLLNRSRSTICAVALSYYPLGLLFLFFYYYFHSFFGCYFKNHTLLSSLVLRGLGCPPWLQGQHKADSKSLILWEWFVKESRKRERKLYL